MFDMKNLTQLKKLDEYARGPMKAFWTFDKEDREKRVLVLSILRGTSAR
jgi:hypothetical protein